MSPTIVLDTNVLVSGILGQSHPRDIKNFWVKGKIWLAWSDDILREYTRILRRMNVGMEDLKELTGLFNNPTRCVSVVPKRHFNAVKEDPSDDKFLDCAVEAGADAIISGDKALLRLRVFQGIPILSPREFLARFRNKLT